MESSLADIGQAIADGDVDEAIRKLRNLRRRFDSCEPAAHSDDWITECSDQIAVRDWIDTLIANLSG